VVRTNGIEAPAPTTDAPADRHLAAPSCSAFVDLVVLAIPDGALRVLLVDESTTRATDEEQRAPERWRLPSMSLDSETGDLDTAATQLLVGATVDSKAARTSGSRLEQLRSYRTAERDGKRYAVTVAYVAAVMPRRFLSRRHRGCGGSRLIRSCVGGQRFPVIVATLSQTAPTGSKLARIYEIVWQCTIDERNFHRKFLVPKVLCSRRADTRTQGGRPAALYRRGDAVRIHPAIPPVECSGPRRT
jgi:8-oxo-dGTP diphosphatase